ncbi:hypothetical protein GQF56_21345 [Rhodobacter sphaeroides]|jgi:hypothetical protein|uniref:Uncharacterized protein n=3 Tax=Cereibacter sphaeroides TaxID=1063 RepID=Q3IV38_CERS4|nr:hypothetical protein [Cereibacter sphaeroides]ABA81596.1 hypothetical protein RSP_4121 [Cereibacter sphaeroides 2.4.1]ANS36716.1 hypothetical protein A3858_20860 [Cereibacter sphaeroides]ATN65861.1 hypothetical protein A3857_21300 [Cereibacter sphaeroides]AXC64025.1 hypothetical protein DQL45_21830 [Cereibacter sphaeroides 2.4.1]MVX50370.1 hypothetical protein [Cereibacter sphaeroides]
MEKDFTASLTATLAQSGGAAGTLDTALLLLMNTVHIAEPASFDLLLGLSDGRLPSGPALETLSQLPGLKATTRTLTTAGTVKSLPEPKQSRPVATNFLRGMGFVLQYQRCRLAATGKRRDELVEAYIGRYPRLNRYESLAKTASRYHTKLKGAGLFASAEATKDFVRSVLHALTGPGLARPGDAVDTFRDIAERARLGIAERMTDGLASQVICALFDFHAHEAQDIQRTIESLKGASSVTSPDFGILPRLTADILPPALWAVRNQPFR